MVDGVYTTGDLIEASVLSMHGMTPSMELESQSKTRALFVFDLADQDEEFVQGLLDDLRAGKYKVEPKRFAREMAVVRGQLYDFLRVDRDRLRLRQS
jgi:hypothetical protein